MGTRSTGSTNITRSVKGAETISSHDFAIECEMRKITENKVLQLTYPGVYLVVNARLDASLSQTPLFAMLSLLTPVSTILQTKPLASDS